MTNDPLELSFDIYQRYRAVSTLLGQSAKALGLEGARVLDVGSGHENFLGLFLPHLDIHTMDAREPPEGAAPANFVVGDALAIPFEDDSFDFCCSIDNLEHIQPEDRPRAIDELIRVARGPVIIACPCGEDDVEEYEALANSYCASVFGSGYEWLEEHQEAPLPNAADIVSHAENTHKLKATVFPNAYLPRWVEMITLQLLASHVSSLKEYWGNACRLYNKQIYPYDNKAPCYRRVVVLTRDELPLSLPAETEDKQFRIRYEILRNAISQRLVAGGTVGIEQHYQSQLEQLRGEARKLQRQVDIQASQLWEASGRERHKSAKIVRLEKDVKILQERLTWEAQQIRASATWRVGRLVLMPLLFARKALGAMKSRFAGPAYTKQDSLLVQFTPPDPENPYYVITGEHLRKRGWNFEFDNDPGSILAKLTQRGSKPSLVHFHQFDPYVRPTRDKSADERTSQLISDITRLKQAGAKLVWTLHNRLPHDATAEAIEIAGRMHRFVAEQFDLVFVMGEEARQEASKHFDLSKIRLVPHTSYQYVYGAPVPRNQARERLKLPADDFIFETLGTIRPYKGLELIVEAFRGLEGNNLRLLIAGGVKSPEYLEQLRQLTSSDERILIHGAEKRIPAEDMALWLGVPDAAVFGFKNILTSGSAILALSYGLPVIAPKSGDIPAMVIQQQTGFLYEQNNVSSLRAAMQEAAESRILDHMRFMAGVFMERVSPEIVTAQTEEIYAHLLGIGID